MNGNLPWPLVFTGVFLAVVVAVLGIPVLPFAVGLYLPIHLSVPMMVGGLVRLYFEKRQNLSEQEKKDKVENGVLYSSGLIAGEGLVGILLAVFAVLGLNTDISGIVSLSNFGGIVCFALLTGTLVMFINRKAK